MTPRSQPPKRRYDSVTRQAHATESRRRILAAAHSLFIDAGFAGTTIAAIADAADVSAPTVYAGFASKAELLRHAIEVALAGDDEPVAVADRPTAAWVNADGDGRGAARAVRRDDGGSGVEGGADLRRDGGGGRRRARAG